MLNPENLFESTAVFLKVVESMDASDSVEWNGDVEEETGPASEEVATEWEWGSFNGLLGVH